MIAIYTRQSLEKQDSISLESQANLCKGLINNEEFKIYEDSGFSGKNISRPSLQELLKDIEAQKINKVICYKLDRISRSILDFNNLLVFFKKYNVEFISYSENLDTSSAIGRAMVNIIATFAQLERETIAERVKVNYYARGEQGRFLGGTIPFGFNKSTIMLNGKTAPILVVNEEQAETIKYIFYLYAESSMSLGDVQRRLNDEGIKSSKGKNWDSSKVSKILRSPLYVRADINIYNYYKSKGCKITNIPDDFIGVNGCFVYGKREANERRYTDVKDHVLSLGIHEGIIDSNIFLKVQQKLDKNKQIKRNGKGNSSYLGGLFKCSKCGYGMSVQKSGKKRYLNCRGKYIGACEGNKTIHLEEVENLIDIQIEKKLEELSNTKIESNNRNDKVINEINIKITKIDEQITQLLDKIIEANAVVMDYINKKIAELDQEKQELLKQLQDKEIDTTYEDLKEVFNIEFQSLDFDKKKEITRLLIDRIEVSDEVLRVVFKI